MLRTIVLAAALGLACGGTADAKTLNFKFKSSKDVKDFKTYGAKWQVKSKAYGPVAAAALPTAALVSGTKFKAVTGTTSVKTFKTFTRAGVMARAKVNGTLLYGYFGGIFHDSDTLASARIFKFDGYNISTSQGAVIPLCQAVIELKKKKEVEFKVSGTSLGLYYNGVQVCAAEDAAFKNGQVGLMASPLPSGVVSSFSDATFKD